MNSKELFETVHTVLVIDFPNKDVPEIRARAGFHVVVHGGPGPDDYSTFELNNGAVIARRGSRSPERADLIYAHRPLSELREIVDIAKALNAKTLWTQSGLASAGVKDTKGCWVSDEDLAFAQNLARSAGLNYITRPYSGSVLVNAGARVDAKAYSITPQATRPPALPVGSVFRSSSCA